MTLPDIENLSFADLKAKRAELVADAKKANAADLAERYVQARTDAKQRDETLATQGATITALQQGNAALTEKVAGMEKRAADLDRRGVDLVARLDAATKENGEQVAELRAKLAAETARADAATALAKARRKALADIGGIINPLLAAE